MNEKKMNIIETGMRLFAIKGYHSTSIQEIATESGISKGAFYLYFQSKEDFISTAIHHFNAQITGRMEKVQQGNFPPKESLAKQITVLMDYIYKYKDFIIMHIRENISIGENTDKLIKHMKIHNYHWMRRNIINIYGDKVNEILIDAVILLEGMMDGYFKWIVIENVHMDRDRIGLFLVRRLDDVVRSMLEQKDEALVTIQQIPPAYVSLLNMDVTETFSLLKEKLQTLNLDQEKTDQLKTVTEALEMEAVKSEPQPVMIQGLLAHFEKVPELQEECKQLAEIMHVELLNKKR